MRPKGRERKAPVKKASAARAHAKPRASRRPVPRKPHTPASINAASTNSFSRLDGPEAEIPFMVNGEIRLPLEPLSPNQKAIFAEQWDNFHHLPHEEAQKFRASSYTSQSIPEELEKYVARDDRKRKAASPAEEDDEEDLYIGVYNQSRVKRAKTITAIQDTTDVEDDVEMHEAAAAAVAAADDTVDEETEAQIKQDLKDRCVY